MKKLLALVMAILMVLCTFASCGGGSASGNTDLPDDEKQQTEDNGQSGNIENDKPENGGQNNQDNNGQNTGNNTGSNNGGNGGTPACVHVDNDKNHSCDKCNDKMTDCADASKDHKCDICVNKLTDCVDNDKNHACDICTIKLSDCADNNKDHNCDLCGADNGVAHIEGAGKHSCDYCGIVISICIDNDTDHKCDQCGMDTGVAHVEGEGKHSCDYCGVVISICIDNNTDHKCDQCGIDTGVAHVEGEDKHTCGYCGVVISICIDNNTDHKCDQCGIDTGVAHVEGEGKHSCDYCGVVISICIDNNTDHKCDQCGATGMGTHADGDDNDHLCDYCEQSVGEDCYDIEPKDHICDECGATGMGAHADNGNDGNHLCEYCGQTASECADNDYNHNCDDCDLALSTHNYQDGYCTICGEEEPIYIRKEKNITFGSYPQIKVTDSSLTSKLKSMAGTLPTSDNSQAWTSYGYYISGNVENFMWYIDITIDGENYRGVYFTSWRPKNTTISSINGNTNQINKYNKNNVFWFKYEPISWTILSEDATNGTALILCDMIIDSQQYDYDGSYSNNYAESTIRKWLNDTFYNTAFNEFQKQMIVTTTVDNSAKSTGLNKNDYACEDTQDKIFLLSYEEITNADYGFSLSSVHDNTAGQKKTTDYAQAQGAYTAGYRGYWWLRSPISGRSSAAYYVNSSGHTESTYVYSTSCGVVPALQIRLFDVSHNCTDGEDKDHICDYCNENIGEYCYDIEPKDHICDECGAMGMGSHADNGNDGNHLCEYCGQTASECADNDYNHNCDDCDLALSTHNYQDGYCTICGEEEPLYVRKEKMITFGYYPQTKITDSSLISTLNGMAGTLPTNSNSQAWTSYRYYISGKVENFMWYIDIEQGGERYRGVYFTFYRPNYTSSSSSTRYSYQDDNEYTTSIVYWFKYEPISWTILSENTTNGTALILCDMIIDSQAYQNEYECDRITGSNYNNSYGVPSGTYANNYAYNTIRKWLNGTFYNTAFNELQKQIILTTTVDNSAATTNSSTNQYACENTEDKIFLLSYQDIINPNYGFSSSYSDYDAARQKKTTDYAQAQGALTSGESYDGNGHWFLRSPSSDYSDGTCTVYDDGHAYNSGYVLDTSNGVVPALTIKL